MKKFLSFFYSTLIIVLLSNNYSFGQACHGNGQWITLQTTSVCNNNPSTFGINIDPNFFEKCDEFGWCDSYSWITDITIKRSDGSTALIITEAMAPANTYVLPAGFF